MAEPTKQAPSQPATPDVVRVINANDEVYRIPADQAADVLKNDSTVRPITPADDKRIQAKKTYGGALGQAGAGLLGLSRGLAGPIPDIAGAAIGGDSYRELAIGLEDANPGIVSLGEAAGLVAPALMSGGTSLAARGGLSAATKTAAEMAGKAAIMPKAATAVGEVAGKAVGNMVGTTATGTVARGLQKAASFGAQMAAENALLDASKQMSDDIVRDHEFHAENYVASAMRGALTGAAFGVPLGFVGGVIGRTVQRYADKLSDPVEMSVAQEKAYEHAAQATGAKTAEYRKFVGNRAVYDNQGKPIARAGSDAAFRKGIEDIGEELLSNRNGSSVVSFKTQPGTISRAANLEIDRIGNQIGEIHDVVKDTKIDAYDTIKKMVDDVVLPNENTAMTMEARSAADKVRSYATNVANDLLDQSKFKVSIGKDGELAFESKASKEIYYRDAGGYYRIDQTPVKITYKGPNGNTVTKKVPGTPTKVYEPINPFNDGAANLERLRTHVKEIDRQLPKQYEGLYGEKALSAQNYMQLRGSLEEQYEKIVLDNFGQDKYKELADLNRRYGIWKTIEKMSVSDRQRTMANLPRGLVDVQKGGILANIGTHVGIATGQAMGVPYMGPILGAAFGTVGAIKGADWGRFLRDRFHAVAASGYNKVVDLSKIAGISKQISDTANKHIDAFVAGTARTGATVARTGLRTVDRMNASKYQQSVETVQRLNNDPQALMDHVSKAIPEGMAQHAPEVMTGAISTYQRGIGFLATKIPPAPRPINALQPGLPANRIISRIPSDADRDKWSRYVAAMENPLVMLQQAAAGRLDRETVETVKTIYPQMFAKMRSTIVAKVAERKTPLTTQQTTALSMILDTPLTAAQEPQTMAVFQAAFDMAFASDGDGGTVLPQDGGQNGGASSAGPAPKGDKPARPIDIHGAYKTTTQGMRGELR